MDENNFEIPITRLLHLKSALKLHVQFRFIAWLIACVHGKVRSLSKSSWLLQPITKQSY